MPKALIVEDEPEANELLAMLVQLRGYETDSAFTGEQALTLAEQARPDIVFLDLMLPDINGFDVCRALKGRRDTSAIPVVMVTARIAEGNRLQGLRAGATEYVSKPYTPDQIFQAMEVADSWTQKLARAEVSGTISTGVRSEIVHLGKITNLWSLLLERSPISEDDARSIDQFLVEVANRSVEWGHRHGQSVIAHLDYRFDREHVAFHLMSPSGWFEDDSPRDPEGLGGLISRAGFDEVHFDDETGEVVLIRRFSSGR